MEDLSSLQKLLVNNGLSLDTKSFAITHLNTNLKESQFNGVRIKKIFLSESKIGPFAHFIYDFFYA